MMIMMMNDDDGDDDVVRDVGGWLATRRGVEWHVNISSGRRTAKKTQPHVVAWRASRNALRTIKHETLAEALAKASLVSLREVPRGASAFIVFIGSWFYRRLISVIVDLSIHQKRDKNIRGQK